MDPTISAWGTEITTVNGSDHGLTPRCETMSPTLSFLTFSIALHGLAGNDAVLWLLGFRTHRNAFTVYVLNLAGADFLFLCFHIVFSIESIINFISPTSIQISRFLTVMFTFAYIVGLSMLSAISAEGCLCALWPIWYHCRHPRHTSAVMCVLLWASSLFLSLLEGAGCGFLVQGFGSGWYQTFDVINVLWVIILFVVLFGSSLALLVRIFCGSRQTSVTRLYVTIALTVLVFLLFGLPFGINWFVLTWIDSLYYNAPFHNAIFHHVIIFLSCVNSCVNPIFYFFVGSIRHRRFQRGTLKLLLQRALQDTPEKEECGKCTSGKPRELEIASCSS
ncbi:mas-related G-protein coupled receptor member X2-like [Nannospalax galili]|uniref:mas-related G-protein coupled receptor member X2-like n=1 Tax=Nannospalax galili TaxID=1026970 RepID=UPI0004ED120E|nr:mas-related G-protein coupled receptor member X2-like [Nannospalax galili]